MSLFHSKRYLLFVGFIVGFSTMILEVVSVRLFGPYFGTSIIVWTNVISVILCSLSLGYYFGGKKAERNLSEFFLAKLLVFEGLVVMVLPFLSSLVLPLFVGTTHSGIIISLTLGSFFAGVILFGFPVFLLGFLSVYLLSLMISRFGSLGDISGKFLMFSTLGGLLGTFLPTILLTTLIGTKITILICGAVLLGVGLTGVSDTKSKTITILFFVFVISITNTSLGPNSEVLFQGESQYQYIDIVQTPEGTRFMRFDSGFGLQSVYNENKILSGKYFDYVSVLPNLLRTKDEPINILLIGLAGGTVARQLNYYYGKKVSIDAVEIDSKSSLLAKEYMGLKDVPINIIIADGRYFLKKSNKKYDLIYVDAYSKEFQMPWTMATREFWRLVSDHLSLTGMVGVNVATFGNENSGLISGLTQTALTVFPYVYDANLNQINSENHLVVMSFSDVGFGDKKDLNLDLLSTYKNLQSVFRRVSVVPGADILTDDRSPVEFLMVKDVF